MKKISFSLLLFITTLFTEAKIQLPSFFCDHMVLQQQTDAAIWGKASPGATVKITTSWDHIHYSVKAGIDGNWKENVKTPVAGGPYQITLSDGNEIIKLGDILIGEVWLCSGQSNMQMPVRGGNNNPVIGSNRAIAMSANAAIRFFGVDIDKSLKLLDNVSGKWEECRPEQVANFSAVAYFFGQMLQDVLDVPVGLIRSSYGGSRIEPWMSAEGLKPYQWVNLPDKNDESAVSPLTSPTVLYNAMIHPLVGYTMKGTIWYQGESNVSEPDHYRELLPGLINDWRSAWGIGDFPFYCVQIAPFDYGNNSFNSAFLREAQLKAVNSVPNSGIACLIDAGEEKNIHPANKEIAGERLAYLALAKTYGKKGFEYCGPEFKTMTVKGNLVTLTFSHAENGLTTFGSELNHFKTAGKDKRFYPAHAIVTETGIDLFSFQVDQPVAVRYAFDDFVVGELYNTEGLPASSFRTDDWNK
ncbi:MAG: sialate O-acetylesterase [Mangrovibacterium sp.]